MASKNKNKKKKSGAAQKSGIPGQPQQQMNASDSPKAGTTQPYKTNKNESRKAAGSNTKSGLLERLIGVVTLKRAIYREIAEDPAATIQAAIIVVIVALITGLIGYLGQVNTSLPGLPETEPSLSRGITLAIGELIIWAAGGFLIAQVARYLFRAGTDTSEMLRVFGFSRIFQILFVLGVFSSPIAQIVSIAGLALSIAGSVIGIREAGEISTGKAVITGVFAIVLVWILVSFFVTFVLNPYFTMLLPT